MSLYQAKPMEDPLVRQAREDERRAARLEARKPRVLHAKTRLMGIDVEALDQQTAEKADMTRLDMERDLYFDRMRIGHNDALTKMENMRQQEERERAREMDRFRQQQEREKIRDKMVADSIADSYKNEETTFLRFKGEDPMKYERTLFQKQQQMDWLNQQVEDLQGRKSRTRLEDAQYTAHMAQITELRRQMEEEAEAQRRALAAQNNKMNQGLAVDKRASLERDRRNDEELARAEIEAQLASEFMNENQVHGKSNFKGFSSAQRDAILEEQARQVAALRERKAREASKEAQFNQDSEHVRRMLVIADRQKMNNRTKQNVALRQEQERQKRDNQVRYDYLDNVVYTNPVKESFFEQFGQSAR